jgi:peptide deformylase
MSLLNIILEGDPRLRQKATRIRQVDDSLRRIAADMHETMLDAPGIGLAGPQVGVMRRIVVIHLPAGYVEDADPEVSVTLINPEIVKGFGRSVAQEGCLSIPRWVGMVPRFESITVKAVDLNNKHIRMKAEGMLARVIQHEVDHLDGILFVDRVEDKSTLFEVDEDLEEATSAVAD